MSTNAQLQPAAAATLQRWHQMIASNDLQALPELLHEQAVFRSPMAHTPYPGAPVVGLERGGELATAGLDGDSSGGPALVQARVDTHDFADGPLAGIGACPLSEDEPESGLQVLL